MGSTGSSPRLTYRGLVPASTRASAAARGSSRKTDTSAELPLRRLLWHGGYRYRKNVPHLPGKPDIVFVRQRIAVFCDGDFWHGKDWPQRRIRLSAGHNADYWIAKIERNMERDKEHTLALKQDGWRVMRFWESEIRSDLESVADIIVKAIHRKTDSERD
jgi:DNA mismatch endonuclease (patch repair protein)